MNFYQFFGIHGVESKKRFKSKIYDFYSKRSNRKIQEEVIRDISNYIANYLYNNYKHSWIKYPKSRTRYSVFHVEDLEKPSIQSEALIRYLKEKYPNKHVNYLTILLRKNTNEVIELIKKQEEFEGMF